MSKLSFLKYLFQQNYGKTQELIEDLKNENENLVKERNEMENRLHEAEDTIVSTKYRLEDNEDTVIIISQTNFNVYFFR